MFCKCQVSLYLISKKKKKSRDIYQSESRGVAVRQLSNGVAVPVTKERWEPDTLKGSARPEEQHILLLKSLPGVTRGKDS